MTEWIVPAFLFCSALACYGLGWLAGRRDLRRQTDEERADMVARHNSALRSLTPSAATGFEPLATKFVDGRALQEDTFVSRDSFNVCVHNAKRIGVDLEHDVIGEYLTTKGGRRLRPRPPFRPTVTKPDDQLPLAAALHEHIRKGRS